MVTSGWLGAGAEVGLYGVRDRAVAEEWELK